MDVAFQSMAQSETKTEKREKGNLLDSDAYLSATGKINIPIGKTDTGEVIVRDLDEIPHILVCGFTGSGKTSFVQTTLAVICKDKPKDDVRLVIYDSKGVEYTAFRNAPQLLIPIIIDRDNAIKAITDLANESQERFKCFAELGCKDLEKYNQRVSGRERKPIIIMILDDYSALDLDRNSLYEFQTILKNGRIAGIHLIVVSSISASKVLQKELISNIPCRISFKLTSKTESKNVLESHGAEMLNVPGEIIYKFQNDFYKCQCAYATFENIEKSMKTANKAPKSITALGAIASAIFSDSTATKKSEKGSANIESDNERLIQAGRFVISSGKASIGELQRYFRIGFNAAARLMDDLEIYGVVGPVSATKPRAILMTTSEWERICSVELGGGNPMSPKHAAPQRGTARESYGKTTGTEEKDDEPKIKLRDFAKFKVDDVELSVSDHKINYTKSIMTRLGPGTISPSFSGSHVTRIIYKKPSFFSKGFFTFEFRPDINIVNPNDSILHADINNISEIIKVEFGSDTDRTIRLFLQQISEDIGIPISKV